MSSPRAPFLPCIYTPLAKGCVSLSPAAGMKLVILVAVAAVAVAAPQYKPQEPVPTYDASSNDHLVEVVPILKDEREQEDDGRYSVDVETGNGIILSESGSPVSSTGTVVKAGSYSYTAPDGSLIELKFVADENGYQPQSDYLPVAPAFPHPIPQFVLDQIAFAAEEDAARARNEASAAASGSSQAYASAQ
ncbi:endocuticle structural glycoprotein SgAbd-8-like isoform X1 [Panulirus ornatus]|uniref:endocuticle structural glycoprotein SgAbd-8-like isoform X1 n=1 Tax=Panulirus ornatus TaxID=150431 RepID=UPI003A8882E1